MDAAGKDGTIKHVMSGVNPQGCEVHSFKAPSSEELDHDFLWRTSRAAAAPRPHRHLQPLVLRGNAGRARAPEHPGTAAAAAGARDEEHLARALRRHQRLRALPVAPGRGDPQVLPARVEGGTAPALPRRGSTNPRKHWKFSLADVGERAHFAEYMRAYEDTIRHTSTEWAPWHVIPADRKWFTRLVVAATIVDTIESLDPRFPNADPKVQRRAQEVRKALVAEVKAVKATTEGAARNEALLVAGRGSALRPLSRRRMGPAGHRRHAAVREDLPRGLPGGPELDHHPPQARELPEGVRRLRSRRRSRGSPRRTSSACSRTRASSGIAARSNRPSTTPSARWS